MICAREYEGHLLLHAVGLGHTAIGVSWRCTWVSLHLWWMLPREKSDGFRCNWIQKVRLQEDVVHRLGCSPPCLMGFEFCGDLNPETSCPFLVCWSTGFGLFALNWERPARVVRQRRTWLLFLCLSAGTHYLCHVMFAPWYHRLKLFQFHVAFGPTLC